MVDPDVYAMIEENISEQHLALDFDDMGSDSSGTGGSTQSRPDEIDAVTVEVAEAAEAGAAYGGGVDDISAAIESREDAGAAAEAETRGQMGGRR